MALILLGTVVLWENDRDSGVGLVFSDADLDALKTGMRVTGPQLSGASLTGDLYDFRAETVVPTDRELTALDIQRLVGEIRFRDSRTVSLASDSALIDLSQRRITLISGIDISTSDGYRAQASRVDVDTRAAELVAQGPILADGPLGRITADTLILTPAPVDGTTADGQGSRNDALIRFEGGVTLRYTPGMENR